MSDNPDRLTKVLLQDAPPEVQAQFLEMLAQQKAQHDLQKTHRCWFFVPTPTEWERLRKYAGAPDYDKCPRCRKGRVVVEVFRGNIGDSWHVKCRWGEAGCDFKEYVSDGE